MILSGLTIVVGLASIGVNRLLIRSQDQVLKESIAVIERTERVGRDVDRAAALVEQLAKAATEAEVPRISGAVAAAITDIEAGIAEMRRFLTGRAGTLTDAEEARLLAAEMTLSVRRLDRLQAVIGKEKLRLETAAERLVALTVAGTNLARLRITAGIWELYRAPVGQSPRPLLDHLADRDFFVLERLGDLSEATARLTQLVGQIVDAGNAGVIDDLEAGFSEALSLAQARTGYLPAASGATAANREFAVFARALGPDGLIAVRREQLATSLGLEALSVKLDQKLAVLADEAQQGRNATRAQMQARIADAGWWAMGLTAALAAIVVLAVLAGYLVWSRTRSGVVLRMGMVAERMVQVARGETGEAMRISGHDEIGQLEKSLNVLRRRTDEAMRLRQSLETAVLERTADVVAEMKLANAARAEAEELSIAKTRFLARMSHEIRTPLNGVIGLLDLLVAEDGTPARRARLETALTSARDLQAMTEDILSFSVGEEWRGHGTVAAFDPAALARGLGDHLQVLAQAKGLLPVVRVRDLPPVLMGDAGRIRQVLVNLISNAVKYTDAGEVRLEVSHRPLPFDDHEIAFRVADTGPGMTAEETRHAFDVYGRTADARRKGLPGVGLGLAIVRQLTDAMGGELRVSTAPGQGSSFTLVLRLREGDASALIAAPGGDLPHAVPQMPGLAVLVVDDHPVNRLVARGYLERMGAAVTEAGSGAEALARAADGNFDAILIDLDLPDMRGEEVVANIDRKGARLAIFTADLVRDDAETRVRFGVDHVLTKPLSPRALAGLLEGGAETTARPAADDPLEASLRDDMANLGAELAADIVAAFLTDLVKARDDLVAATDPETRRRIAHRLKGAASNFGLLALCDLLQRIEKGDDAALSALPAEAEAADARLRAVAARIGLQPDGAAKQ